MPGFTTLCLVHYCLTQAVQITLISLQSTSLRQGSSSHLFGHFDSWFALKAVALT